MVLKAGYQGSLGWEKDCLQKTPEYLCNTEWWFLYPSALGTIKYNGVPMYGRQMVDVLNAIGLDLVTFGNHEFDIPEPNWSIE